MESNSALQSGRLRAEDAALKAGGRAASGDQERNSESVPRHRLFVTEAQEVEELLCCVVCAKLGLGWLGLAGQVRPEQPRVYRDT